MKSRACSLSRMNFGDHSIKYRARTVASVCFVSSVGWTTQLGPVMVTGEGAREEERSQGREEGRTHESAAHPASGPHLESDTAALRGTTGNV